MPGIVTMSQEKVGGHWDALRTFVLGTSHPDRLLGGAEAAAAALGTGVDLGS